MRLSIYSKSNTLLLSALALAAVASCGKAPVEPQTVAKQAAVEKPGPSH